MVGVSKLRKQHGLSLTGLILALILIGLAAVLGMQVVPAVVEYQSIKKAVLDARDKGTSAQEIKFIYSKEKVAGYFSAVEASDLVIVKEDGMYVVSFAYEKKLPLVGPASLLLEFSYSTDSKK